MTQLIPQCVVCIVHVDSLQHRDVVYHIASLQPTSCKKLVNIGKVVFS